MALEIHVLVLGDVVTSSLGDDDKAMMSRRLGIVLCN